jgi:hypothetical protein
MKKKTQRDGSFYMGGLQGLASMERTTAGSSASLGMTDLREPEHGRLRSMMERTTAGSSASLGMTDLRS